MGKKTISNTFTVNTVEDGESAPYYFQEWFAWSNDASTLGVTTPPTIGGSWATSIPSQGSYAYLWRKSIRYVWNENTRQYSSEAAQYFRMSGTDGTSIRTRGQVANASSRGNGTATIITDSGTQTITLSDGDAVTQLDNGHLYQWITEGGGKWLDLGQFKGESGKTYYTHVAWATKVNYNSSGEVTSVEGFTPDKSPNDTTHLWMGVLVNESSGIDPSDATSYTWSYTKGVDGFSVQAQYAPNNNPSSSQIHNTWQNGDIYMRTKQSNETNWSSWNKIVGESGDETDYTFNISKSLTSTNATTAPANCYYNTWQDAPVAPTSDYPYLWMKIVKKTWNESTQSYDSGTPSYARITGEKGENAFVVDLENEMTNLELDEIGNTTEAIDFYFKVQAYYGTRNVLNDCTITASCEDADVTVTTTAAKTTGIRVQISQGIDMTGTTDITVTVTHSTYGARTVVFTMAGIKDGENAVLQELLPSLDAISFARTASGGLTPSSRDLTLSIKKTQGGSTSTQSISDSGLTIRWSSTSMPASETGGNGWGNGTATGISWNNTTMKIANNASASNIYIAAFKFVGVNTYVLVDRETIPVIKDGKHGDGGVSYSFVFTKAAARVDENNIVTAELAGYAYKYVGGVRSALTSTTIRYGYILTDSDTYADKTTNSSGFFDAGTWFNGDDITDLGKNSPSIFAAIIIGGTVVHAEMITISVKGNTGSRGKIGRFFYFGGTFNPQDNDPTHGFVVNDAQAPYFEHIENGQKRYHVFNYDTNGKYTMAQMWAISSNWNNKPWESMRNDFKYIITEAIFGAYAHFGANIINKDFRLSQYGYMRGFYDSKVSVNSGTQYIYFDDSDPFGDVDMFDKPANKVANQSLSDYEIPDSTHYVILGNNIEFAPSNSPSTTQIENTFTSSCYYFRFKRTQDSTSWSSWLAFSSSYYFALSARNDSAPSTGWNYSGTVSNLVPTEEKPYLWMKVGSRGTPFLVSSSQKSFTIEKGRYYAISIKTENYDAGDFDIMVGTKNSNISIASGSLKKELIGDALTYYGIFSNQSDSDLTNANLWTKKSGLSFTFEAVYKAQFVPTLCEDLKSGKLVVNNVVARGELHADSLYYSMYDEESNNGTIVVEDKSIVSIGTKGVGSVVKLPSPSASKGRKVEVYNYATSWKATWDGATSTSTFSCPYGSGLDYRTVDATSKKYVLFYCDGSTWWILRAEN